MKACGNTPPLAIKSKPSLFFPFEALPFSTSRFQTTNLLLSFQEPLSILRHGSWVHGINQPIPFSPNSDRHHRVQVYRRSGSRPPLSASCKSCFLVYRKGVRPDINISRRQRQMDKHRTPPLGEILQHPRLQRRTPRLPHQHHLHPARPNRHFALTPTMPP